MKTTKKQLFTKALLFMGVVMFALVSCKKEEDPAPDPIASFQFEISGTNYLMVTFTNFSQNAVTYSWNFGDGNTSTEASPVHTYTGEDDYTVVLTATNKDGVDHQFQAVITITDPDKALKKLTGEVSKTWKLYRVGTSMSLGPDASNPGGWWPGLENNGARPCSYYQEFTFHFNGSYVFDDKDSFWGEYGVWGAIDGFPNSSLFETCFAAIPENMVNAKGDDVSAWLSGTHSFTYNVSAGTVTLTGNGAWIGIPKLGTTDYTVVPVSSVTFNVSITEHTGYDLMTVTFNYGAGGLWTIVYVNYSNPALEPAVVVEEQPWGEDLANITPVELSHTFETASSYELIGTIGGASILTTGEDDPAGGATKVGKLARTADQYQEATLRVSPDPKDIEFDNLTTISIDVYLPSSNTYDPLTKKVIIGFGDVSATQQWWNGLIQYESAELALDTWVTVTFELDTPSYSSVAGQTPFDRDDLDMIFIQLGGGGHTTAATFYVRNFVID
jgi:PKD repeat protein